MFIERRNFIVYTIGLLLTVLLVGCEDEKANRSFEEDKEENNIPIEPIPGGSITGAIYSAPAGMFNPIFHDDPYEANILSFTHESLVSQNERLEYVPQLAKSWELNDNQTELTLHLQEGVKWHDGEEFTASDVVFTYQAIADPDYINAGGIRTAFVKPLLGYDEYVNGETDELKGVVAKGNYIVTFKFADPIINPLYFASSPIIPEHIFKDIPIDDMPNAEASLLPGNVIGTGPFQLADMVEGEEYTLKRHDEYWQGTPYLEQIVWRVVAKPVIASLLENGEIDFIGNPDGISPTDYETINKLENIGIIEQPDFGYELLGFKHHHQTEEDVEKGVLNPDNWQPNKKLSDPKVRQAIAYGIDREKLINELLNGHGELLNSPIAKQSWAYDESVTESYTFDLEKAKDILQSLGYVDTNDDGFREDPDGNAWVLNFDYPTGNKIREQTAPLIVQMLEDIGIKVELRKPKEMFTLIQELTNDNNDLDLYLLGWNLTSSDPDPSSFWETMASYNFSRWNNPESDELLNQARKTPEAFSQDYRASIYRKWQKLYSEDLPAFILYAQNSLWAYNNRLQGVQPIPFSMYNNTHLWWVSEMK
ncbi:ABC transporter substrate-binding protein [Ornithinibacillus massiliensis]|uniref:ABC transporter substrate-binding protein n=1 Tax=Ornithinibacillus massiliensis TaxID=1944633 RepID=UPI001FE86258|nr:ABC transporter substrate-binding protein [Ornithinibacillus massiliensis]